MKIADRDERIVTRTISEFNQLVENAPNAKEFIRCALLGTTGGEGEGREEYTKLDVQFPSYVANGDPIADVDSVIFKSNNIPVLGPLRLQFTSDFEARLQRNQVVGHAIDGKCVDIGRLPNIHIGTFGYLGRFNVS